MRKIRRILNHLMSLYILIVLFSLVLIPVQSNQSTPFYGELLYQTSDQSQAEWIAHDDHISLINYSSYGIATYAVQDENTYQSLLNQGFDKNSTSRSAEMVSLYTHDQYSRDQYAIQMMNVEEAWQYTEGSSAVTVAIIDSGIDTSHPEFTGRISSLSYNSRTEQVGLSYVVDDTGHGTAVAGVIGAIKDNNIGIAGIVQNAKLMVIKANNHDDPLTPANEAEYFDDSSIISGIYYAADHGANVINLSLGGADKNNLTQSAITYARGKGVIVVAAAGNDGTSDLVYPASYDGVISVSAVNDNKDISTYSNYGSKIDLAAPGDYIVTTTLNGGYSSVSGTSFASPQVAGVAALLISYYTEESSDTIINRLTRGAVDDGTPGWDQYYGYGIVNAQGSMIVDVQIFTVSFDTDGGSVVDPVTVYSGLSVSVSNPYKTGYTFEGWYKDSLFTEVFHMGVDLVTSDMTLYAKFVPIMFTIHFVTSGTPVSDMQIQYGDTFVLPSTTKVGYTFDGWYIDSAYTVPYPDGPVLMFYTLYAHFIPNVYQVNYYVNDSLYDTQSVTYGNLFDLIIPEDQGHLFVGWYTDNALSVPYVESPITENLDLYAKFDDSSVRVTFYESDLATVQLETYVSLGGSLTVPIGPTKPSSPSFDFVFTGWSESLDNIEQSLSVYPLYDKIYKPESIVLMPGIDTITLGTTWSDSGTSLSDPLLTLETRSNLDLEHTGVYTIYYDIYDQDQKIDTRIRVIHVIEAAPDVVITMNPDVTTIIQGDTYQDQGATSNMGDVITSGSVDTNTEGVYLITYTVTINDLSTTAYKYVYVLPNSSNTPTTDQYYVEKRSGWML